MGGWCGCHYCSIITGARLSSDYRTIYRPSTNRRPLEECDRLTAPNVIYPVLEPSNI